MLEARLPEKEKQVKKLKPDKKELEAIEQTVKVRTFFLTRNKTDLVWKNFKKNF